MTFAMETERLLLRHFTDEDAGSFLDIARQPFVMKGHNVEAPPTIDDIRASFGRRNAMWREHGFCLAAVIVKGTGRLIGSVGLGIIPDTDRVVEVVWTITDDATGKGYATEAAAEWVRYGLEEVGLDLIVALANPDNIASIRVMEKLGMTHRGIEDTYYGHELVVFEADTSWLDSGRQ